MEYKRITSKGGVNIPVKLRRSMGMEGVCRACADQLVDEYVKQKRKELA